MRVELKKVYRVVSFDLDIKVGDFVNPSKWDVIGERKKKIEDYLETNRPHSYPKRDECLYVCFSKENAYEWARIKYSKRDTPYKLLTLDLTGDLYWFMAEHYNVLGEIFTQEQLEEACKRYWNSKTEDSSTMVLGKEYEGLFVGEAVVKAIEYKNYMNGESMDVE